MSRLPVTDQVFLGFWMVDIHQEGHSQRSAPQRRHMAHLRQCSHCEPRKLSSWDQGGDNMYHPAGRVRLPNPWSPQLLKSGKGTKHRPNRACAFVGYPRTEPERLRPGKCAQPRACFRQFPYRATWSLSSVDQESTHAMSGGKPNMAQTLQAGPSHTSNICLKCSSLPQHD